MSVRRMTLGAGLAACAALAFAAPALADPAAHKSDCFLSSNWDGWSSPSPGVILLRVNQNQIWRLELSTPTTVLDQPSVHLVNIVHGSDWVCSPLDLELRVVDNFGGFREPVMVKSITHLSAEEASAVPPKFRP